MTEHREPAVAGGELPGWEEIEAAVGAMHHRCGSLVVSQDVLTALRPLYQSLVDALTAAQAEREAAERELAEVCAQLVMVVAEAAGYRAALEAARADHLSRAMVGASLWCRECGGPPHLRDGLTKAPCPYSLLAAPVAGGGAGEKPLYGVILAPGWSLRDVLARLADAADHLLRDHNCDAHGYEGVGVARDVARTALGLPPREEAT